MGLIPSIRERLSILKFGGMARMEFREAEACLLRGLFLLDACRTEDCLLREDDCINVGLGLLLLRREEACLLGCRCLSVGLGCTEACLLFLRLEEACLLGCCCLTVRLGCAEARGLFRAEACLLFLRRCAGALPLSRVGVFLGLLRNPWMLSSIKFRKGGTPRNWFSLRI